MYAFYIDVVFTSLDGLLYVQQEEAKNSTGQFVAIGGIILAHGILHLVLFEFIHCCVDPSTLPAIVAVIGYIVFAVFTFALSVVILLLGFVSNGNGWRQVIMASAGVTTVVVILSVMTGTEWLLPALSAISHPLSSVTELFSSAGPFWWQHSLESWSLRHVSPFIEESAVIIGMM